MKGESAMDSAIRRARMEVLKKEPCLTVAALTLEYEYSSEVETARTNGVSIQLNKKYFRGLTEAQRPTLLAHEVLHCALMHFARLGNRDAQRANIAMDHAINNLLVEQRFESIPGWLCNSQWAGLPWETIYSQIPDAESAKGQKQSGDVEFSDDEVKDGKANKPKSSLPKADSAAIQKMQSAVTQGVIGELQDQAKAKKQGKNPGKGSCILEALSNAIRKNTCADAITIIRRHLTQATPSDYCYTRPDIRTMAITGTWSPTLHSIDSGSVVFAIDTSYSLNISQLELFWFHLRGILTEFPTLDIRIIQCTDIITDDQTCTGDCVPERLYVREQGGTDFRPVFDAITNRPDLLIYFTDLDGDFPKSEPEYPVLWLTSKAYRHAPWGNEISLDE